MSKIKNIITNLILLSIISGKTEKKQDDDDDMICDIASHITHHHTSHITQRRSYRLIPCKIAHEVWNFQQSTHALTFG